MPTWFGFIIVDLYSLQHNSLLKLSKIKRRSILIAIPQKIGIPCHDIQDEQEDEKRRKKMKTLMTWAGTIHEGCGRRIQSTKNRIRHSIMVMMMWRSRVWQTSLTNSLTRHARAVSDHSRSSESMNCCSSQYWELRLQENEGKLRMMVFVETGEQESNLRKWDFSPHVYLSFLWDS